MNYYFDFDNEEFLEDKDYCINDSDILQEIMYVKEKKINTLCLKKSYLTSLPFEIFSLSHLTELDLSDNHLNEIPKEICKLKNLTSLCLRGNELSDLPDTISDLKNLNKLDLSENEFTYIPDAILSIMTLQEIDLSFNNLTMIPSNISQLKNLKSLDLSLNRIIQVPFEISLLNKLQILNLSANQISEFPSGICDLTNLQSLILSENHLTSFPDKVKFLKALKALYLRKTELITIPKVIFQLRDLEILDLRENILSDVIEEITNLQKLKSLYLSNNQFKEIPECITKLNNLKDLHFSTNFIEHVPDEISQLSQLTVLTLDNNKLFRIEEKVVFLPNLRKIRLDYNPLEMPPIEIAHKGLNELKDYYESLNNTGTEKLNEAKLIIVGQGGVGKTCLCKRLVDNNFAIDINEPTTEGLNINKWCWSIVKGKNKSEFKVNIWDFGGQEIYHATHQFFLTKRSLYIFMWDARKEDGFEYWLNIVSLLSNNSPILIVLNKIDERIVEIDQAAIKGKFKNVVGFYKISCLDGRGINELTNEIKTCIVNLPHVGADWPKIWTEIRHQLESDSRDYIEYREYKMICKTYDLNEEKANYLSSYLHDLGVILHFQDDPVLKETVILKPEWGTNAVYKVLDSSTIQERKGRLLFSDLSNIWNDSKYPSEKHYDLLQLMMKFELCFKLIDYEEYIIPEILSLEKPQFIWDEKDNDRIEYHYDFMPSGIITRFIARNYRLIKENIFWRNGAMLNFHGARALVFKEQLNRKIHILLNGINKWELFTIIENEFEHIHETLNNPPLKQMVPCTCNECKSGSINDTEYYEIKDLQRFILKSKKTIQCRKSLEDIPIERIYKSFSKDLLLNFEKKKIFISYSHKDYNWLEKLKVHLKPYERSCDFSIWDDTRIKSGGLWFDEIMNAIISAKIAILLVSPEFLASDFIVKHELPPILNAAKQKGVIIFWICISASAYKICEIAQFQCANNPDYPLDLLSRAEQNSELVKICEKLANILNG